MNFQQQPPWQLSEIIDDLEKGDGGPGTKAGTLSLIETTLFNGDVSLGIGDIMNQARQHLRISF